MTTRGVTSGIVEITGKLAPPTRQSVVTALVPASAWLQLARKIVVALLGFTLLALGVAVIALPLPGGLLIPLGLAILATEFAWARTLLLALRNGLLRLKARGSLCSVRSRRGGPPVDP